MLSVIPSSSSSGTAAPETMLVGCFRQLVACRRGSAWLALVFALATGFATSNHRPYTFPEDRVAATKARAADETLTDGAIALYQTASWLFKHGRQLELTSLKRSRYSPVASRPLAANE